MIYIFLNDAKLNLNQVCLKYKAENASNILDENGEIWRRCPEKICTNLFYWLSIRETHRTILEMLQ